MKKLFYVAPVVSILFLSFIGFDQPYKNGIYETYEDYMAGNVTKLSTMPVSFFDGYNVVQIHNDNTPPEIIKKNSIYGFQQRNQFYRCRKDGKSFRLVSIAPYPLYVYFRIAVSTQYSSGGPVNDLYFSKDLESPIVKLNEQEVTKAFPDAINNDKDANILSNKITRTYYDKRINLGDNGFKGIYLTKEAYDTNTLSYSDLYIINYTKSKIQLTTEDVTNLRGRDRDIVLPSQVILTKKVYAASFEITDVHYYKGKAFYLVGTSDLFDVYFRTNQHYDYGFITNGWNCQSYYYVMIKKGVDDKYLNKMLEVGRKVATKILSVPKEKMSKVLGEYNARDKYYQVLRSHYDIEEVIWK